MMFVFFKILNCKTTRKDSRESGDPIPLTYAEFGFNINTVGVYGNAFIDAWDGRYGSAVMSIGKHYAFHGLGRGIDKVSGGLTDRLILDGFSKFYENYVIPRVGESILGPTETFQRIEYKIDNNYNLKIK